LSVACHSDASPYGTAEPAAQHSEVASAMEKDFHIEGRYAEACSCGAPCPCELVGPDMTCQGVGAYQIDKGSYDGKDFSGTRFAYALYIGKDLRLYFDAPTPEKRAAVEAFARAALADFGPIQGVSNAKIEMRNQGGAYSVVVGDGTLMNFGTEAVLGGDQKTPIAHHNTYSKLNPVMYQGRCTHCTVKDGDMGFSVPAGRNAYFNDHVKASGKI